MDSITLRWIHLKPAVVSFTGKPVMILHKYWPHMKVLIDSGASSQYLFRWHNGNLLQYPYLHFEQLQLI